MTHTERLNLTNEGQGNLSEAACPNGKVSHYDKVSCLMSKAKLHVEYLPGVEDVVGIEGGFYSLH